MIPNQELTEQLFRERVERAQRMSPEEKLYGGPRLFEQACQIMRDGIRHQFPDADEARVTEVLRERLALIRKLEGRQ